MSDIIVIGGGIAGLSAAARLSEDAHVTVLERETSTGYHASGRSAALFEQNYGLPSTIALNKASAEFQHHANGGYTSPRGLLITALASQEAAFRADLQEMGVDEISCAEAIERVPILDGTTLAFAGYHAEAYDLDTDRMMQDFIRALKSNGGQVITQAPVTEISRRGEIWQVRTPQSQYQARRLVNAAGAWADEIADLAGITRIGLTPCRRSMARVPAPEGRDTSLWPMFFGVSESWYAKPDAGALLISPADEEPVPPQDAWADDLVLAEGIARYQEVVRPEVTRVLTSWAGLRSFAPDHALVLGPDPDQPDFIWCAAQGGYGFQTAPAASQLVADLTFKRAPAIAANVVAQLKPERLRR